MAVGDEYRYLNGNTYVETDGGPNVWANCYLCNAPAVCHLEFKVADIRCGACYAREQELLPGQRVHELIRQWQQEHPLGRWHRGVI